MRENGVRALLRRWKDWLLIMAGFTALGGLAAWSNSRDCRFGGAVVLTIFGYCWLVGALAVLAGLDQAWKHNSAPSVVRGISAAVLCAAIVIGYAELGERLGYATGCPF